MRINYLLLCTGLPLIISLLLTRISINRLYRNPMITISPASLKIFLITRLIYWIGFGILTTAFLLAMIQSGTGGEQTRALIARSHGTTTDTAKFILSEMSNYILPVIFLSLFIAVIALGLIGRAVVRKLPKDEKPGIEFTHFRFTFVLMALSLIIPPLLFGSLLLL
jgi:hypothetical protein